MTSVLQGSLDSGGELIPFPDGCDQTEDWYGRQLCEEERMVLNELKLIVWCSTERVHDMELRDYRIELCSFYFDNSCSRQLIDMLKLSLTGEGCGEEQEIAALEKLKGGIDEIIARLKSQL